MCVFQVGVLCFYTVAGREHRLILGKNGFIFFRFTKSSGLSAEKKEKLKIQLLLSLLRHLLPNLMQLYTVYKHNKLLKKETQQ